MTNRYHTDIITSLKLKLLALTTVFTIAAVLAFAFWPRDGHCRWCPSFACYNSSQCGSGCQCMKSQGDISGACVSFDRR